MSDTLGAVEQLVEQARSTPNYPPAGRSEFIRVTREKARAHDAEDARQERARREDAWLAERSHDELRRVLRQARAALAAYGEMDTVGRWHECGCEEDKVSARGEPLDRCSFSRAALAAIDDVLEVRG